MSYKTEELVVNTFIILTDVDFLTKYMYYKYRTTFKVRTKK
jgi:hypothetical protein